MSNKSLSNELLSNKLPMAFEDIFPSRDWIPGKAQEGSGSDEKFFTLSSRIGEGCCRTYSCSDYAFIIIADYIYYKDCLCEFTQPECLTISYYSSVSGELLLPYRRLVPSTVYTAVGRDEICRFRLHKKVPIKGISIILMPKYYKKQLQGKYPEEYESPGDAFAYINGMRNFPQLISVLNQLKNYKGSGMSAKMFYQGKIDELVSLVVKKSKELRLIKREERSVSQVDREVLASIASYLDDHYALNPSLDFLAKVACMSPSKLKYSFRSIYHCSIKEYIQNKRIAQAKHLLLYTDLSLSQISQAIGYKNQGSFSSMFKQRTGLSPLRYKRFCKRL